MSRSVSAVLLLLPLALGAQQPDSAQARRAAAAVAADTAEIVLVDLRIENAAAATIQAYRYRDQALIPVGQFLTLAEIQHTVQPGGRIDGSLQPAAMPFSIDPASDTAVVGSRRHALRRTERLARDGDVFIDAEQLGPMFGVRMSVDWSDLLVSVTDAGSLPVAQRQRRRHARSIAFAQARQTQAIIEGVPLGMLRPAVDGAVLDYSLTMPNSEPVCGLSGALAFGANIYGGSLEIVRSSSGGRDNGKCTRVGDGQASWTGVWLHDRWLKQARLGDGISTGVSPRQLRGALISNSPYIREPTFGSGRYVGFVGRGWEVEAYRSGGLVAVDTADSTGRFDLNFPITYGDNPVYFFAYGPYGEERRFDKSYRVVYDLIPRKTFEYGLSGGVCPVRIICQATGNVDLRYGVTQSWTARAGFDHFRRDSLPDLSHPYTRLTGVITNALSVDLRATYRALLGSEIAFQPSVNRRASLSYTVFDTAVTAPILTSSGIRSQLLFFGFYRPGGDNTPHFLQWDAEMSRRITSRFFAVNLIPSTQTTHVRYMPRLRLERVEPMSGSAATNRAVLGLNTFILFPARFGRFAASTNGDVDLTRRQYNRRQYNQLGASLITRLRGNEMVLVSSVNKSYGITPIFSFSLQTNRTTVRALSQAVLQKGTQTTALQTVQGSVVHNRATSSMSLVAGPSLQRSGVTGRVYLDANANGVFDAGDEPLPRVFVRAASGGASTDTLGRFAVWDIPTFSRTMVAIDSASLESPLWIPAVPAHTIEPGPNHYRPLDLAVLPGGSIDGTAVRASGALRFGLPGVRVTLTNLQTRERSALSTFGDGGFSFLGVRPGTYEMTLDPQVVTRFAGTFEPETVVVRARRDGDAISDVELAVVVAPPPAPVVVELAPPAPVDSDGDGVLDPADRCPNTPAGVRVDVAGCPILFRAQERTVTLRGVTFQTGSSRLTAGSLAVLDSVAATLLALPDVRVEIGGHTDNSGGATLNLRLSQARARAVMNYLAQRGVPLARMSAIGYGPRLPVAPNTSAAGRAQNRRVELRRIE